MPYRESLALLDALFESAPIGLAYFDRELRYARVNEWLAQINGLPAELHVGRTIGELLPDLDPRAGDVLREVLTSGRIIEAEVSGATPATAGDERLYSLVVYPVRDEETEVIGVGAVAVDITDRRLAEEARARAHELERAGRAQAEDAAARARFLAEASMILISSLDYDSTLRSVAQLAVPLLADWCTVDVAKPDGSLRRVATAHVDPAKIELAEEIERRFPRDATARRGAAEVIRSARAELYPEVTEEMLAGATHGPEHAQQLRAVGMRSVMIVPMVGRERTLGAITFVAAESGHEFGAADLQLAEELGRRAGMVVENARLYSERSYIARTLQQSLLPPHLPDVAGVDLVARYLPAGEGNEVGGDFYDVFALDPLSWAVVIGDVQGKGADAAALTALVRHTVRALASAADAPSETLRRLNAAIMRDRSDTRFATAVLAWLTPIAGGFRVALASAGHPHPIVIRAGGDAEVVRPPGTLLGVFADATFEARELLLHEGDSLALYTDGVTEAGAPDRIVSPDQLAAELASSGATSAAELAATLERAAAEASGGNPRDDIAIVALCVSRRTPRV